MDKNKAKLTFLLLVAAVPVSLATWFYGVREIDGVSSTTNRGELIVPVMDITEFDLRDENRTVLFQGFEEMVAQIELDDYEPRPWMLLYLGTETCESICDERLYFLRQLHHRLSAESDRVTRYYVNAGKAQKSLDDRTQAMFDESFAEMEVVFSERVALLENLSRTTAEGINPIDEHYIYVVDPIGNVMLYFTPDNTTEEIFKDIDKLLDQSSLG